MSYTEHLKGDSKLIWVIMVAIGGISGNIDRLSTALVPSLDETFVTEEELELRLDPIHKEIQDIRRQQGDTSTTPDAVLPVEPNGTIPRIRRDSRET